MIAWILFVTGLMLGGVAAWVAADSKSKGIIDEIRGQLGAAQAIISDKEGEIESLRQQLAGEGQEKVKAQTELKILQEAERNLSQAFDALADKALKSNNQAFLELARSTFETIQAQAKGDLETRQKAIDGLVRPLKESLSRYEKQIQELEASRQGAYGSLEKHLNDLQSLTGNLNIALRGSHTKVRGRWGEMTLHTVAELAGMSERCDFSEQETLEREAGRQRPDMIVNLPGGRRIPVDSKAPLEAFLGAVSAETEEERKNFLAQHSSLVRAHVDRLAKQNYPALFQPAPEIVVMFLPGEPFLAAALEADETLMEDAMRKGVLLATPTILIALLLAIHHGWQQEAVAQKATEIKELGQALYERIRTASGYLQEIGSALGKAVGSYNNAVGSLESRFFPAARKFKDLVIPTGEEIESPELIEAEPRALISPEWKESELPDEGAVVDCPPGIGSSRT